MMRYGRGREEQQEEGSNTDFNDNEEGVSSSTKKARVDINAFQRVHPDLQRYDNREEEEEEGKSLELCLAPL